MTISIALITLLATFATGTPNLCDDVYLDSTGSPYMDSIGQTLARFCEWTGPDAPVWDANVCCVFSGGAAACSVADSNGRCSSGGNTRYCEYGEVDAAGEVTCYQPFPDACEAGFCGPAPEVQPAPQAYMACCTTGGICQSTQPEDLDQCDAIGGAWIWCDNGTENPDGTLDCWD